MKTPSAKSSGKLTSPKRCEDQKRQDRARITELYLKGFTQKQISEILNSERKPEQSLTQQQISYDLGVIRKEWLKSTLSNFDELKSRELAKIDAAESAAWMAWERSCEEKVSRINKRTNDPGGINVDSDGVDSSSAATKIEKTVKREHQVGDPRFLDTVAKCRDQRCKLLGLYAPTQVNSNTNLSGEFAVAMPTAAEARNEFMERLAGLGNEAEKIDKILSETLDGGFQIKNCGVKK